MIAKELTVNRHSRILIATTVACLLLAGNGCKGPPLKPTRFNDTLAKATQKLAQATRPFRKALLPLGTGQPANPSEVQNAFAGMERALKEARSETEDISPPSSSKSGPTLLFQYKNFLDSQETILTRHMKGIVDTVNNNQLSPADKWGVVQAAFAKIEEEENRSMGTLRSALSEFQKEHNLRAGF
jgi:hypothetical protein